MNRDRRSLAPEPLAKPGPLPYPRQNETPAGNFTVRQLGFTTQYAFSSTLSWSNLVQHDNVSENMGFNSRLHWIPKAGQQAFLVLNWGMIDADKDNSFDSTIADLSLKVNYTFRF